MIVPTELLKKMVDEIVLIKKYNTFNMRLMLRNKQDPSFSINDARIDVMSITQDFMNNTTDDIQLTINVNTEQIQQLVSKQSDLYADILIEYVNPKTGQVDLDEDPLKLKYMVFLHDLSNLTKKYGVNAFEDTQDSKGNKDKALASVFINISMQLITENEYKANKSSFIGTIRDISVEDTIKYAASVMGISKIKMDTVDNQTKYQHMPIPPEQGGFRAFFDYLQQKHGVYTNGFRHYMTNGTLHVYPPFLMDNKRSPRLNVLRVSENSYMGSSNFHRIDESKNLTIVSNTTLSSQTLSNVGSENDGNTKIFVRSDGVLDGQVDKNKMSLRNLTASLSSRADSSIQKNAAVAKYIKPTLNLFGHASSFSEANTEMLTFGWSNCRIGCIEPGMPTSFIFDEKNKVMVKKGVVEVVKYSITKISEKVFSCNAVLVVRSDPKAIPYET